GGRGPGGGPAAPTLLLGRRVDHLVGDVVAVLLGVEPAPLPVAVEELRLLLGQDPLHAWVAVRDGGAGELVVLVVLAEAAVRRVDRRGGVAALRDPADRLVL